MPDRQKAGSKATANDFAKALGSPPRDVSRAREQLVRHGVSSGFMEASLGPGRRTMRTQCLVANRFGKDDRNALAGGRWFQNECMNGTR